IDFIFIDGSHHYANVRRDFELALPLVKAGGWIALHDVVETWPGPLQVWREEAVPVLENHQFSSTLACGRKKPDAVVQASERGVHAAAASPFLAWPSREGHSNVRELKRPEGRAPSPQGGILAAQNNAGLESPANPQAGKPALRPGAGLSHG